MLITPILFLLLYLLIEKNSLLNREWVAHYISQFTEWEARAKDRCSLFFWGAGRCKRTLHTVLTLMRRNIITELLIPTIRVPSKKFNCTVLQGRTVDSYMASSCRITLSAASNSSWVPHQSELAQLKLSAATPQSFLVLQLGCPQLNVNYSKRKLVLLVTAAM